MTVKTIIFDFDGTLADTLDAIVRITNQLAGEFGYQKSSQEDVERLRSLSSWQIIKNSGIPPIKIPFLLHAVKAELNNQIQSLSPATPGIFLILKNLKELGYQLGIVTSNSTENVMGFINKHGWSELFDFIYSGATLFGKTTVIKKVLMARKLKAEETIYVGDETRDIEAAKKIPVIAIAVSWGFNSRKVLAQHQPDFLIDRPNQIIEAIASLQKS
ncbi:MAG: HAD-IA family hydrolase [Oscillatoria sp. SIO1A7]|nr:HAD-IA family hydrolase [Oscillatoria sp. SIO1A7]